MVYKISACDLEFCKQNSICFSAEKQTAGGGVRFCFVHLFKGGRVQGTAFLVETAMKGVENICQKKRKVAEYTCKFVNEIQKIRGSW